LLVSFPSSSLHFFELRFLAAFLAAFLAGFFEAFAVETLVAFLALADFVVDDFAELLFAFLVTACFATFFAAAGFDDFFAAFFAAFLPEELTLLPPRIARLGANPSG
jgi:hypothetical protein